VEAQRATGMEVAQGVLSILHDEKPENLLNPEIYAPQVTYFDNVSTIIFDCDSTLVSIEGIDELARNKGVEAQIIPLTEKAMNGEIDPEDVFKKRLEIIKPTKKELLELGNLYITHLLPGTKEIIRMLKNQGINIYIVSGGYDLPLHILADYLDIPRRNVYANKLLFTKDGEYKAIDKSIPLWKKGGKKEVINSICHSGKQRLHQNQTLDKKDRRFPLGDDKGENGKTILVGNGVTDAQAKRAVDIFIGFGGVKKRDAVKKEAHIYLETPTLAPLLHIAKVSLCRHNRMNIVEREYFISGLDHLLNPEMTTFANHHHKEEIVQQLLQ
jgi:phosphoserine phosphatase